MKPRADHFRSLDGLRGLACLGVAMHHCSGCIFVGGSSLGEAPRPFFYGFAGVEAFFALSGFLLALPILKRRDERVDWGAFAWRRVRRIVPPAWGAMLVFIAIGIMIRAFSIEPFASAHPISIPTSPWQALAMFLFWGRIYMNSSYWTMAVEVRWYFVLPLLLYALRRFGPARLLAGTLATALAFAVLKPHLGSVAAVAIGPLPMYLPLFSLGVAFADMIATQPASGTRGFPIYGLRACLFVSAALVVAFTHSNTVTLSRVLPASLLGFFLLVSAVKDPVVGALLSWRPLAWVGGFSFSVYLTHEVVINLCSAVAQRFSLVLWEQFLVYFGVVPLVMLPVAYGFHLVLERPFQRKKAAIRPGPTVVAPGV